MNNKAGRRCLIIVLQILCCASMVSAQSRNLNVHFEAQRNGSRLELLSYEKQQFKVLKFYLSNIKLLQNDNLVYSLPKAILIDYGQESTCSYNIKVSNNLQFNAVQFDLGIDSATNASGAQGGELDPTNGMYWAWQSGYINFKLEGTDPECPTRKNEFQFHLGGYQNTDLAVQTLKFPVEQKTNFTLLLNLDHFFEEINLKETNHIMSPGTKAVQLSEVIANCISIE